MDVFSTIGFFVTVLGTGLFIAATLAELSMYVDVSIDVLNAIVETGGETAAATAEVHVMGQLAALRAVKVRLA